MYYKFKEQKMTEKQEIIAKLIDFDRRLIAVYDTLQELVKNSESKKTKAEISKEKRIYDDELTFDNYFTNTEEDEYVNQTTTYVYKNYLKELHENKYIDAIPMTKNMFSRYMRKNDLIGKIKTIDGRSDRIYVDISVTTD
jgi:hypothetical protein